MYSEGELDSGTVVNGKNRSVERVGPKVSATRGSDRDGTGRCGRQKGTAHVDLLTRRGMQLKRHSECCSRSYLRRGAIETNSDV